MAFFLVIHDWPSNRLSPKAGDLSVESDLLGLVINGEFVRTSNEPNLLRYRVLVEALRNDANTIARPASHFLILRNGLALQHRRSPEPDLEIGMDRPFSAPDNKSVASGRTAATMAGVVQRLNPFGMWQVTEYRYATGEGGKPDDDQELRALPGSRLRFEPGSANVGGKSYEISSFEGKTVSNADPKEYFDTSLAALGIPGDNITAVRFTCDRRGEPSQHSFLLRVTPERAIMLWSGVFLELKRVPTEFRTVT